MDFTPSVTIIFYSENDTSAMLFQ